MSLKMLSYVKEQPAVWQHILDEKNRIFSPLAEKLKDRDINRIILLGTGSSLMASQLAAEFFNNVLEIETTVAVPTRLGKLPGFLDAEKTLVVASSQTGRSTSTLGAINLLREKGFTVIAVTAIDNTPIVNASDFYQAIECGEETVGPKTKGMTATFLTLYLMGMELCKKWGILSAEKEKEIVDALNKSFAEAPGNIEKCCEFCQKHADEFAKQPHMALIGDGFAYPTLQEGALKILESLDMPVFAYEFEEYLHGVNNTITPGMFNIIVPVNSENFERIRKMDSYAKEHGCIDYVITTAPWKSGERLLQLSGSGKDYTIPFEILPAFHAISVFGSMGKGLSCDEPRHQDFYILLDTKEQDKDSKVWQG